MDTTIPIPFPFPLQDNDEADLYERAAFWDLPSTLEWFRLRGYTLYEHNDPAQDQPWYSEPTLQCPLSCDMQYPYPYYESEGDTKTPFRALEQTASNSGALFGSSSNLNGNPERELPCTHSGYPLKWTFLLRGHAEVGRHSVPPEGRPHQKRYLHYAFLAQSMFVQNVNLLVLSPQKEQALVFLHEHNILHRDIKLANVLVSHFADEGTYYDYSAARERLQWSNQLTYCLFDFDISMMLPADTDQVQCRFPYKLSWDGSGYQPRDTSQGEFDYNPFAYDVGTLGRVLCTEYQHLTPQIPMLTPFLDRMVTRNIPVRFNSMEALQLFEALVADIPDKVMNLEYPSSPGAMFDTWDRWEGLPPDFIKKWEDYREPPIPFSTFVLRWICSFDRMCYIVPPVRRFFFRITLIPSRIRLILRKLLGLPHSS
ncbi:hypothetical protein AGABI2DRAFT_119089 [Agaricus bisporus var. bisporus H97]|uniref:hypothetical protein n=1 Tax=Agaricus bisporus var. bisporus (strain H97 / ATCC MYA-4626 / FGSC 10389) TaxID=936046 RepID=UPI00029F7588|nr:hypothetical protein AGABI2DRAFT_119089 [Agaricus bisporus var. bisporus H97]EKV46913.1 hypothetical protein AGABI2DRAFT_119089 [Agaricus bisporus var. bisporus H97]